MSKTPIIDTSDMDLLAGKTCATCLHYARCKALFACPADAVKCDFAPLRYRVDAGKVGNSTNIVAATQNIVAP